VIEAAESVSLEEAVLAALREVSDPELDESLVELGFVDRVEVDQGRVEIVLRLPTFWCAPNFAYLMAHDAREQTLRVPGVRQVEVSLKDHMCGDEIGTGVSAGQPFGSVFPGQTDGDDLGELRALFRGKAFGMRQEQLVRFLLEAGLSPLEITALQLGDVVDTSDSDGLRLIVNGTERLLRGGAPLARAYLERRVRVGLGVHDDGPLVTDLDGVPVAAQDLEAHLQRTRRQRISMTFNAMMCRGLLETRYGLDGRKEAVGT
jgi:metal-sulfur cluster biosynthetic enzyme